MQQFCVESTPPPCKLHKKAPLPLSLSGGGAHFRVVSPCRNAVRHPRGAGSHPFWKASQCRPFRGAARGGRRAASAPENFRSPAKTPVIVGATLGRPKNRSDKRRPCLGIPRRRAANVSSRGDVTPVGATIGRPQKQNDKCHPCPAGTSGAVHDSLASGSASRSMPRRFRASSKAFEDISGSPSRVSSARRLRAEPSPPRSPLS